MFFLLNQNRHSATKTLLRSRTVSVFVMEQFLPMHTFASNKFPTYLLFFPFLKKTCPVFLFLFEFLFYIAYLVMGMNRLFAWIFLRMHWIIWSNQHLLVLLYVWIWCFFLFLRKRKMKLFSEFPFFDFFFNSYFTCHT